MFKFIYYKLILVCIFLFVVCSDTLAQTACFNTQVTYPVATGSTPNRLATDDFNNDGNPDLIVADYGNSKAVLLLGSASGTFATGTSFTLTGNQPIDIITGDFNNDGKKDFATANVNSSDITVKYGDGTGTFTNTNTYAFGSSTSPYGLATADLNSDGNLDLVVARTASASVAVLFGSATGTFATAVTYGTGTSPQGVILADFNNDGKTDIATANAGSSNCSVLFGSATGTFATAVNYGAGNTPRDLASGDLNADGYLDLVIANVGGNNLSVLLGSATGTFASSVFYTVTTPNDLVIADFNSDGKLDIVTSNDAFATISVLPGNGSGTFGSPITFNTGSNPRGLCSDDFNGDGALDVAVVNNSNNNLSVFINCNTGAALFFDGANDYVITPSFSLNNQSFTIEFWAKRSSSGNVDYLFSQGLASTNGGLHMGFDPAANTFHFGFYTNDFNVTAADLNWHHWACVYDNSSTGANRFIYKDGELVGTNTSASSYTGTGNCYIGTTVWNPNGDAFKGTLDEVRIWNVARSQCDIQTYMKAEIPTTASGLLGNYHFNQGLANTLNIASSTTTLLTDFAGTSKTGTLTNFALTGTSSNWVSPGGVSNGYTTTSTPLQEIDVTGNGNSIVDGDITPISTDFTDFGSASTRTFVIKSTGSNTLNISAIYISGVNASQFSITTQPASTLAALTGSTYFVVAFSATTSGVKTATINIQNSDCSEPVYDFAIQATMPNADALDFDGSNDGVTISNNASLTFTSGTIEAMVKINTSATGTRFLVNKEGAFAMFLINNTPAIMDYSTGTSSNFPGSAPTLTNGGWHHLALTFQNGVANGTRYYVDGVPIWTGITTNATTYTNGITLGNRLGSFYYMGDMDNLRIWNTVRTECEIQSYMSAEITTTAAGLVANYNFNQGVASLNNSTVTSLTDASGNGNNGTLNNFALSGTTSNWITPGGVAQGYTTVTLPTPEINLTGNGNNIVDGDVSPSTSDFTDFGSATSKTFVIQNTGSQPLYVLSTVFSGTAASLFSVTTQPSTIIAAGGSSSLVVAFTPTATGTASATINISSNDCDEAIYDFVLQGTAPVASALNLDGTNDYLNSGSSAALAMTSAGCVEGWFKTTATATGYLFRLENGSNQGFEARLDPTGKLIFSAYLGSWQNFVGSAGSSFNDGNWHHFAIVINGTVGSGYIDGVFQGSLTGTSNLNTGSQYLEIGRHITASAYFNGNIDEIRVWNTARTQCEIQTFKNAEIASTASGLVANYHFNQGSAGLNNASVTSLTDFSGSGLNCTLNNFALSGATSNWVSPGGVVNGFTTSSAPTASASVSGNSNSIPYASVSTSTSNNTNFGNAASKTFVITNTGTGTLNIGTPYFTGASASMFSLGSAPAATLAASASTSFNVSFNPTSAGSQSAMVNFNTNDCSKPTFSFAVSGDNTASALDLDGANDYVGFNNSISAWNIGNVFTIETWIKPNSISGSRLLMYNGYGCVVCPSWALSIGPEGTCGWTGGTAGRIVFTAANTTSILATYIESDAAPSTSAWTHVAVTGDGNTLRMFVNGVQQSMTSTLSFPISNSTYRNIGADPSSSGGCSPRNFYGGALDEMRIWNYNRSQCQIQSAMNAEITTTASGLTANYHFNQGVAGGTNTAITTLTDASASANTGTLSNFNLSGNTSNWVSPGSVSNGFTVQTSITASISVSGNGNTIPNGNAVASATNFTDFNGALTRTFVISNTGTGTLTIGNIAFTGAASADYSISTAPASSITTGNTSFVVTFSPTATGTRTASILISSNDCSIPVYSFVISGTATPAAALNFDPNDDYVSLPSSTLIPVGNSPYTIEAKIKPTAFGNYGIIGWGNFGGTNSTNALRLDGSGYLINYWWSNDLIVPAPNLTNGAWHHVAATYDGTVRTIYIDGTIAGQDYPGANAVASSANLRVGCTAFALNEFFYGGLDEVRVWNIARTACEIQSYKDCEIPTTASGLVLNYHFNQGIPSGSNTSVTTLTDAASGITGTLTNFALTGSASNWISPGGVTSGSTTANPPTASITVSGNGNAIVYASTTPTTSNFTDFGSAGSRTFVITNSGTGTLSIGALYFTGASASVFSIGTSPATTLAASATTSFSVLFTPTAVGTTSATLNISSNDCAKPLFNFAVQGTPPAAAALSFDGSNDLAARAVVTTTTANVTLQAKVYWRGNNGQNQMIMYNGNSGSNGYGLYIHTAGNLSMLFGGINYYPFNYTLTPGVWTSLTAVIKSGSAEFYVNGILTNSLNIATPGVPTSTFNIGCNMFSFEILNGAVDEVLLWNKALTQCEIQTYLNCEIPTSASNLLANYHFNQGAAGVNNSTVTTITDASGNSNNLNLTNFVLTGTLSNWIAPGAVVSGFTTTSAPSASLIVSSNGNTIPIGVSTSTSNNTNLAGNTSATYSATNTGTNTLYINNVSFTGANAAQFSFSSAAQGSITAGNTNTFTISFTPTAVGTASAIVNLLSNDCTNPTYSFVITASTTPASALSFDGVNDNVSITHTSSLNALPLTVEAWIKTTYTSTANAAGIVAKYVSNSYNGWLTYIFGGNVYGYYFGNSSNYVNYPVGGAYIADNNWHHIAFVVDATGGRLYVDGQLTSGNSGWTGTPTAPTSLQNVYLGLYDSGFPGSMDEVRIWNVARTQCEIQQYMNCEIAGTASGLMANYHFNQGVPSGTNTSVTSLTDAAGSNNGTLSGFSLTGSTSNWISPSNIANGYTVNSSPGSTLSISANGNAVAAGATSASTLNNTNFGYQASKSFTLTNTGTGTLNINGILLSGANPTHFSVSVSPAATLAASASTTLTILYTNTVSASTSSAIVSVSSNDCTNPTYSFVITASVITSTNTVGYVYAFAGSGSAGTANGTGTLATFQGPMGSCFDSQGNLFVTDNSGNKIRKITPQGIVTTLAGSGAASSVDGTGASASFNNPYGICVDASDNLYVCDFSGHKIRKITPAGVVTTLAGSGSVGSNNATGASASFNQPAGICTDGAGNFYVADLGNFKIRKITSAGVVTTFAGSGTAASTDGTGTGASFNWPLGICYDAINSCFIVSDFNSHKIRKITTSGVVTTIAGSGSAGSTNGLGSGASFNNPIGVTTDTDGSVYVADYSNNKIRKITPSGAVSTLAGTGTSGATDAITSSATFNNPSGICFDKYGNGYVTDNLNNKIRKISYTGDALNFDGANDYVAVSSSSVPTGNSPYTIESWIKPAVSSTCGIVGWGNFGVTNQANALRLGPGGSVVNYWWNNDLTVTVPSVTNGAWHHVAATFDGTIRAIYVDGVLAGFDTPTGHNVTTTANMRIGSVNSSDYFNGFIDEVRIWNVARTQCQLQTYMNAEITSTASGLVANYHFNQGVPSCTNTSITSLTDATGGNAGTLTGFALTGSTSNWVSPGGVAYGYTTTSAPTASIAVSGNGNNVPMGSSTSTTNFTDFGTNTSRTFSITNSGSGTLNIGGVYFTGTNAAQFSVTTTPANSLTTGGTSFVVTLTPTNTGISTATLNIPSNDCTNPTYSFVIAGSTSVASALNFDGTNDYVQANHTASIMPTNSLSVEAWVNLTSTTGIQYVVSKGTSDVALGHYGLYVNSGLAGFHLYQGAHVSAQASSSLATGVWNHLAGTWDGSMLRLYVNGVLSGTQSLTGPLSNNTGSLQIGRLGAASASYQTNGSIDEVRIWNTTRTQCEIQTYMNAEITSTASGLVANYHFNQGIPSGSNTAVITLTDAVAGNTGTLTNMTLTGSVSNWVSPGSVANGFTTTSAPTASIAVSGNGNNVPQSTSTSTNNFTDFGSTSTRTFVVQNSGSGTLSVNSITLTGANASQFSITGSPVSTLAASATRSFTVLFTPTAVGSPTALVTITSNDCSNPSYSFVISGNVTTPSTVCITPATTYTSGNAYSVKAADFNGDGKMDVVIANQNLNTVSVMMGTGNGTFGAAISYNTGSSPGGLVIADFNNDAKPDIGVLNQVSNNISILMGSASGTFAAAVNYTTGSDPEQAVSIDFNNDGFIDIATANFSSNNLSVLFGTAAGTFTSTVSYAAGTAPIGIATGDFNGDNSPDLAVVNASSNNLSILMGSVSGTFATAVNYTTATNPYAICAADFNNDGKLDLGVGHCSSSILSIFLGNGNGTFIQPVNYSNTSCAGTITFGDYNNDGNLDIATGNASTSNISIFRGTGTSYFTPYTVYSAGSSPRGITSADFNGDGKLDIAVANIGSSNINIFLNAPALTVTATNSTICAGNSATLTASGATSYTWSTASNSSSIVVSPATSTSYTVIGTNTLGCTGNASTTILVTPATSMVVSGNGNNIANNSTATTTLNLTNFGSASSRTFVITNSGSGTLSISNSSLSGANASVFSLTTLPTSSLTASASTSVVVAFNPTVVGTASAVLNFISNDCTNPTFSFVITASTSAASALSLDGSNDYLQFADPNLGSSDFTLEQWVKPNTLHNAYFLSTRTSEGSTAGNWFAVTMNASGAVGFELGGSPGLGAFTSNTYISMSTATNIINAGSWNHVAVVRAGNSLRLFVNGINQANITTATTNTLSTGNNILRFGGAVNFNSQWFNGSIDEVRIWNIARTQCEIQSFMNAEITSSVSGLAANYHFNQGIPSGSNAAVLTVTDAAGSNSGTLTNFALTGSVSNWVSPGGVVSGFTTTTVPSVTLAISGNGNNVPVGVTTTTTNNTNFGTNTIKTFSAINTGTNTLYINSITFTGANAAQFSVNASPASSLSAGGSGTFSILFTPTVIGTSSAIVNINSNDCTNPTYSFVITASTSPASALNFDGASDFVSVSPNSAFDFSVGTVEAWLNGANVNVNTTYAALRNSSNTRWSLHYNPSLNALYLWNGSTVLPMNIPVSSNTWFHAAVLLSPTSVTLYINGAYTGTFSSGINTSATGLPFIIGSNNQGSEFFNGSIDELRVWNTPRTQCQIQQFMTSEITSTASGLIANYHFNQGIPSGINTAVTTLTDAAGSNTGTLQTFALTGSVSNWVSPGGVVNGFTTTSTPTVTLTVSGNGNSVPQGTNTSTSNNTDFGTTTAKTFSITNAGSGTLSINSIYLNGTNASQFSVTTSAATAITTGTTGFVITLTPTNTGISTATVNISTNDCSNPTYSFVITASTSPASALDFDGINDVIPSVPGYSFNNQSFSIEFWAKRRVNNNELILAQGSIGTNLGLQIGFIGGNPLFGFYSNDLSNNVTFDTQWHHWAYVYNTALSGVNRFIYRDGVLVASDQANGNYTGSGNVLIGDAIWGSNKLNSTIDELRIWNVARSQCQIQQFMNAEITTTVAGLTGNYHFNQGIPSGSNSTYSVLIDASGNNNNGTLTNFALTGTTSNWVSPGGVVNGFTTSSAPAVTLAVSGNGNSVTQSTVTSTSNNTDFGTSASKTFSITNTGSGTLNINSIYLTGTNASQFSVTTSTATAITTGTTGFVITLTPTNTGISTATVNITTNDCTNPTYSFVITASTSPASALDFDGLNDFVVRPEFNFGTSDFAVEAWLKPTNFNNYRFIISNRTTENTIAGNFWELVIQPGGQLVGYFGTAGTATDQTVVSTNSLTLNTWQHVAMVRTGLQTSIYINGLLEGTKTATLTHNLTSGNNTVAIGTWYTNPGLFRFGGSMDEVRVWNTSRTQCQLQQYMNCEITSTASGLVANYHFNQGIPSGANSTYSILTDATGANSGTLTNFALTGTTSNWVSPGSVVSGFTTTSAPTATIAISGNGNNVPMSSSTSTNNFTNFGANTSRTFSIINAGSGTLNIGSIYFTGTNAAQFSVTTAPLASVTTGTTGFVITLTPTNTGISTATVNIPSNDCTNPTYSFVITASTSPASALAFDGNDVVDCGTDPSLDITVGTWEAWVNLSTLSTNSRIFFKEDVDGGGIGRYESYYLASSGKFQGDLKIGSTPYFVAGATSPTTNTWYHLALTYDGTYFKLYVNGVLDGITNVAGGNMNPGTGHLSLGASVTNTTGSGLTGKLDEVRLWNVARTQCEIQSYMNAEITSTASGLIANYHFNQGVPGSSNLTTTLLTNATGASNTGTLVGMTLTGTASNWVNPGGVVSGFTTSAAPTVTLSAYGNGNPIAMGSSVPSTTNNTSFGNLCLGGSTVTKTYSVQNSGTVTLYINNINVSGASNFSVGTYPSSVAAASSATFPVTFSIGSAGVSNATLSISSNDCSTPNYSFAITASVNALPTVTANSTSSTICVGQTVSVFGFGGNTFTWTASSGAAPINGIPFNPTTTVTYSVATTNTATGCISNNTAFVTVTVNPLPVISIAGSGTVCSSGSATLTASGANTYTWSNGATTASVSLSPTVNTSFTAVGTDTNGCQNQSVKIVTVIANPTITASNGTICVGKSFTIIPSGANAYTVTDGTTAISGTNAIVSPTVTTNYSVTGSSTLGCNNPVPAVITVSVFGNPTLSISGTSTVCAGLPTTLTAAGANTYTWSTTATSSSIVVSPSTTSTYTLTGTNTVGCVSSINQTVTALPNPTISTSGSPTLCNGGNAIITATGALNYTWTSAGTGSSIIVNPTITTIYTVTGVDANNCQGTAQHTLTVNPIPTVNVQSGSICNGQSFTITPSGAGTGATYTISGGSFTVSPTTSTFYVVIGTSTTGCSSQGASNGVSSITVNPQPTLTVNNYTLCSGNSVVITPTGASTYSITGGTFTVNPTSTTSYSITGTNTAGCLSSNTVVSTVTVFASPTLAVNSGSICSGSSFSIIPTGGFTYAITGNTFNVSPTVTTSYSITSTSTAGCVSSNTAVSTVTVFNNPTITVNSGSICTGQTYTLAPSGASSYTFSSGSATVSPTTNTNYSVTGSSTAGCIAVSPAVANVSVYAVPLITINSGSICSGQNFTFVPGGASTYSITGNQFTVSPASTSIYSVTGTSTAGCVSTVAAVATLTVNTTPTVSAASGSICQGNSYTISPTGANAYTISGNQFTVSPVNTTSYSVIGSGTNGCVSNSVAVNVTVSATPTISVNSGTICAGQNFIITPSGGNTYTYSGGSATVSPGSTSTYSITGSSLLGCVSLTAAVSTVTVYAVPVITVSSGTICQGGVYTITTSGASTYTYSGGSNTVNPLSNTSYSVTGTSTAGCVSTVAAVCNVTVNPSPTLSVNSGTICDGSSFTISPTGAASYSITGNNFVVTPSVTTAYTLSGAGANGCLSNSLVISTVTVINNPTVSISNTAICSGQSVTLTPGGANSYTFSSGSAVVSPTITTSYSVTGSNTAGCVSQSAAIITVSVDTTPTVSVNSGSICYGQSFTINPSGAASYTISGGLAVVSPTISSSYSVSGSSAGGCVSASVAVSNITVLTLPSVSATISQPVICSGNSVSLNGAGALTYTWSNGVGDNSAFTPSVSDVYTVTGSDANGCTNTATVSNTVNITPTVSVVSSSTYCAGESFTLQVNGADNYTWNSGATGANQSLTLSATTIYTVIGTTTLGCSDTLVYTQNISPCSGTLSLGTALITDVSCKDKNDGRIRIIPNITYTETSISYEWKSDVNNTLCSCPAPDNLKAGNYSVTVIVNSTVTPSYIRQDTLRGNYTIHDDLPPCDITIYHGVTSNNDGINDTWQIDNIEDYNNKVSIYNRWGVKLAEISRYDNANNAWPKKEDVKSLPASTYFYVIDLGNGTPLIKGWIELMKN